VKTEASSRGQAAFVAASAASAALARAVEASELVRALRTEVGLSQQVIAQACGVSDRAVREWESGARLRQRHDDRLRTLVAVVVELLSTLTPRGVQQWLTARNRELEQERPVEVLGRGDAAAVMGAVGRLVGGDLA